MWRAVSFLALVGLAAGTLPGDHLAQSNFREASQVWTVSGSTGSTSTLEVDAGQNIIKQRDEGAYTWYYNTPTGTGWGSFWPGDQASAYNGWLKFTLQRLEWGGDFVSGKDVIISCSPSSLGMYVENLFADGDTAKDYSVHFKPSAGWKLTKPKKTATGSWRTTPTTEEMLRCVQSLSGIQIRGGAYAGAEKSQLRNVRVVQGAVDLTEVAAYPGDAGATSFATTCVTSDSFELVFDRPGDCTDAAKLLANTRRVNYVCAQPMGSAMERDRRVAFTFKGLPHICSVGTLTIAADPQGLTEPSDYLEVFNEQHNLVGEAFRHVVADALGMQGGTEIEDTIAISSEQMSEMTADRQMELTLKLSQGESSPVIRRMTLRFSGGHCYHSAIPATNDAVVATDDGRQHPINWPFVFSVPSAPAGDGALSVAIDGLVGKDSQIHLVDGNGNRLHTFFSEYYSEERGGTFVMGTARRVGERAVQLEATAPSGDGAYTGLFFTLMAADGTPFKPVKVLSYEGASRTVHLDGKVSTSQVSGASKYILLDADDYPLVSAAGNVVPRSRTRHIETWRLPRATLSSLISNGGLSLSLQTDRVDAGLDRAVIGPVSLRFPLLACHSDTIDSGDFIGVRLARPLALHLTFPTTAPTPVGDATMFFSVVFQDHAPFVAIDGRSARTHDGDPWPTSYSDYPHGLAAIPVQAGQSGETLGFILREDLSQYDPTKPYVASITVPLAKLQGYAADGVLDFTLAIPPGTGVVKVYKATIAYPTA